MHKPVLTELVLFAVLLSACASRQDHTNQAAILRLSEALAIAETRVLTKEEADAARADLVQLAVKINRSRWEQVAVHSALTALVLGWLVGSKVGNEP